MTDTTVSRLLLFPVGSLVSAVICGNCSNELRYQPLNMFYQPTQKKILALHCERRWTMTSVWVQFASNSINVATVKKQNYSL